MPTHKQKKLAKATVDNLNNLSNITKGELVEMGGYGKVVQETPAKALESKGYQEELAKYGLTEELVSCALVEDIKEKPGKRASELRLASEVLGMNKKDIEKPQNITINFIKFSE